MTVNINITHKQGVALLNVMELYMTTAKEKLKESIASCDDHGFQDVVDLAIEQFRLAQDLYDIANELASRPRTNEVVAELRMTSHEPLLCNKDYVVNVAISDSIL